MKSLKSVIILLFLGAVNLYAQTTSVPSQLADQFFEIYETGKAKKSMDFLYDTIKDTPWFGEMKEGVEDLKTKFSRLESRVGDYRGHEFLIEEQLGSSYVVIIYLVKFERQPIRFTFQFYKPQDDWQLHEFSYDHRINEEFEEQVKYRSMHNFY